MVILFQSGLVGQGHGPLKRIVFQSPKLTAITPETCWLEGRRLFRLYSGALAVSFREHKLVVFFLRG